MSNSSIKILYKNSILLYIMTGAKFVLPLIITACLTRRLGTENYGIITYMTSVMGYFILLFDFGFNYSATKKISQNRNNRSIVNKTIGAIFTAKLLLVLVGLVILFVLIPLINILRNNLVLVLLYYFSTAAHIFLPDFLYRGLEKMEGVTIRYILAKLISAALIFIAVQDESDLLLIPLFYFLGTAVASIYTIRHMIIKLGYHFSFSGIKDATNELKDSFIYFASTFATTALSVTNTLVMGIVNLSVDEIAYWGIAFQIIQAIQAMYDPITTSIYPHIAAKKNYKLVLKITGALTPVVVIGCVATYFLSGVAINILAGSDYSAAVLVLKMLIPILLFSFIAQMIGFPLLGAIGGQKEVTKSTIISACFHLLGIIFLIVLGKFSLTSVSILRVMSEFVLMSVRVYFVVIFIKALRHKDVVGC